jgi:hypothetical protein
LPEAGATPCNNKRCDQERHPKRQFDCHILLLNESIKADLGVNAKPAQDIDQIIETIATPQPNMIGTVLNWH